MHQRGAHGLPQWLWKVEIRSLRTACAAGCIGLSVFARVVSPWSPGTLADACFVATAFLGGGALLGACLGIRTAYSLLQRHQGPVISPDIEALARERFNPFGKSEDPGAIRPEDDGVREGGGG